VPYQKSFPAFLRTSIFPISTVFDKRRFFTKHLVYLPANNQVMKKAFCFMALALTVFSLSAQEDKVNVERACMDYIEGFYEGDTVKLMRSLKPRLHKFGFWKNKTTGIYEPDGQMTFRQALDYAKRVFEKKNFPKEGSPKKVAVLDIMNTIAAAKVTAWWGVDYILLSKQNNRWMIEQVLWEGPLQQ
jgi:hypothetical protein